jgi:hypothetical protein
MTEPTPREVETACHCVGSPHQRDRFVLPADLPIPAGIAAVSALAQVGPAGDAAAALINAILVNGGISEWNLLDENGDRLPINPTNVAARVTWQKGGVELSNAAFAQYVNGKDLTPFGLATSRKRTAKSSPNGQTEDSTSPRTSSSRRRPAPSA